MREESSSSARVTPEFDGIHLHPHRILLFHLEDSCSNGLDRTYSPGLSSR